MFNFFKKKSNPDIPDKEAKKKKAQQTIDEEIAKQEAREKRKELGPNLIPVYILATTIVIGVFFWIYGVIAESGFAGLQDKIPQVSENQVPQTNTRRQDGLIIFERED